MAAQQFFFVRAESRYPFSYFRCMLLQKILHQRRHILFAMAQRGQGGERLAVVELANRLKELANEFEVDWQYAPLHTFLYAAANEPCLPAAASAVSVTDGRMS